jgi:hypothetical protein
MQEVFKNHQEPITRMRKLSSINIPFTFSHKKLDGSSVIIRKAQLRKQTHSSKDSRSKYKLNYINLENDELRSCYIPLLTSFDGKLIDVSQ